MSDRAAHEQWLLDVTGLPTVAGKEERVIRWVEAWVGQRDDLRLTRDRAGNLLIGREGFERAGSPLLITAHMDHPGFVVRGAREDGALELDFLGGVHGPYFDGAAIEVHAAGGARAKAKIASHEAPDPPERLYRRCVARVNGDASAFADGDIAVWDLPAPEIAGGMLRTRACDDLAALVAALAALDELRDTDAPVGVLLTRAEEVGFVGAIAACRLGTIPSGARVLALENSRSFSESPVGAGPIVRIGDRMSVFCPSLSGAVAKVAQDLTGEPEKKVGEARVETQPKFRWQRKLMAGGACEATAFCAHGYDATCVCLPLGNYHNMSGLDQYEDDVKAGRRPTAKIDREFISVEDFRGLVELLIACGRGLGEAPSAMGRLDEIFAQRKGVLGPEGASL